MGAEGVSNASLLPTGASFSFVLETLEEQLK